MHTSKFSLGYFHGENIFISNTMDIPMAHGKMPGDCTASMLRTGIVSTHGPGTLLH